MSLGYTRNSCECVFGDQPLTQEIPVNVSLGHTRNSCECVFGDQPHDREKTCTLAKHTKIDLNKALRKRVTKSSNRSTLVKKILSKVTNKTE